jgi:signal transduction histidine kinase/ActR/RegA family two-component response regulator
MAAKTEHCSIPGRMQMPDGGRSEALILAPLGRDASVICSMLQDAGIQARRQRTLGELVDNLDQSAAAVVAEEALIHEDRSRLAKWIDHQPPWSDFPFVLLTLRATGNGCSLHDLISLLGNVTVLERPLAATSLKSAVRSALRARARQRQAEHYLAQLEHLTTTLELRVEERTRQLSEANRRLQAEMEERERAELALRQAQKMEAIGQLTGGIAHDFNNLLMAITGNLELLASRVEGERLQRYVRNALHGAQRGESLVRQLLAFSRKQRLAPAPVDVNEIVALVAELLSRTIGAGIRIDVGTAKGLWPAMVDATQLELMLLNLAFNARDAMPDGGIITIETKALEAVPDTLKEELKAGQYVSITVSDTGTGMPPEVVARAFDPFFTTKAPGKGTGLGLSQVYGFASQTGGTVKIVSRIGQGTAVEMFLPRSMAPITNKDREDKAATSKSRTATVLVVDDDTGVLDTTRGMLEDLGYRVRIAQTADEALMTFERGGIDLAMLDLAMPDITGFELGTRLQQRNAALPILFCSGYPELIETNGTQVSAGAFLGKPYSSRELSAKLNSLLNASRSGI